MSSNCVVFLFFSLPSNFVVMLHSAALCFSSPLTFCMDSFVLFLLRLWYNYTNFFLLDGTGMVAKPTCSPHPHYLSNPSSHNEANMSNPIIIPCLFNNSGALSRIFFSSLLRVVLPRPFPFTHAGVSWSFPCSRARLHGCHSARGGRVCSLLCKKKNMLYDSLHSALLTYTTTNKIFGGQ